MHEHLMILKKIPLKVKMNFLMKEYSLNKMEINHKKGLFKLSKQSYLFLSSNSYKCLIT
jgi:hypothetical protein